MCESELGGKIGCDGNARKAINREKDNGIASSGDRRSSMDQRTGFTGAWLANHKQRTGQNCRDQRRVALPRDGNTRAERQTAVNRKPLEFASRHRT